MDNLTLFKVATLFYFDIWPQLGPGQTSDWEGTLTVERYIQGYWSYQTAQYHNNHLHHLHHQVGLEYGGDGEAVCDDVEILRVARAV